MELSISDSKQLDFLLSTAKKIKFRFAFSELNTEENRLWEQKISSDYFVCGCDTGRLFLSATFLLAVFFIALNFFLRFVYISLLLYAGFTGFIFLAAGVGKMTGKFIAYRRLKAEIKVLEHLINQRSMT